MSDDKIGFVQSGPPPFDRSVDILNWRHAKGWNEALDIAIEHLASQQKLWKDGDISPANLLNLLTDNLKSMKMDEVKPAMFEDDQPVAWIVQADHPWLSWDKPVDTGLPRTPLYKRPSR